MCRQSLQYALGMETILLVALFALYARYNRRARGLQMDAADEVMQLAFPPLLSQSYVSAQHAKQFWAHLRARCPYQGRRVQAVSSCVAQCCALPFQLRQTVTPSQTHDTSRRSDACAGI